TTLYLIAQEALTNVAKHARAARVSLVLEDRRDFVELIVEDDGAGFDVSRHLEIGPRANGHMGLLGMQERAKLAAGTLEVESTLGVGTTLFVRIPLTLEAVLNHQQKAVL